MLFVLSPALDSSHTGFVIGVIDSVKLFQMFVSSESMEINLTDNEINIQRNTVSGLN